MAALRGEDVVTVPGEPGVNHTLDGVRATLHAGGSSTLKIKENGITQWSTEVHGHLRVFFHLIGFMTFASGASVEVECPGAAMYVFLRT